jgi:Spy/CpxP family protein refolding chaperone
MLGLMELMASQNASIDEMFQAAKYANAYWYPQQTLELATYFNVTQKANFDQADARALVSQRFSSGSGFRAVHEWLSTNGQLPQAPGGGNSCGV